MGIYRLSIPLIFAGISEAVVDVTDTLFLARLGTTELAAVGLADAFYGLALVFAGGMIEAMQIVMARRAGQSRTEDVGRTFVQGIYLLLIVAVVLTIAIRYGSPWLTEWTLSSTSVRRAVDTFLAIMAFNVVFDVINFAFGALFVSIGRTRAILGATVVLTATNVVLDYALIFGNLGLPKLGMAGAAYASLAAEISSFVYMVVFALLRIDWRSYGIFRLNAWDGKLAGLLSKLASPVALELLVEAANWFCFFLIIEQLGEVPLAISSIAYCCYIVMLIPLDGVAQNVCVMTSSALGGEKADGLRVVIWSSMRAALVLSLPLVSIGLFAPQWLVALFGADPDIAVETARLVQYLAIGSLLMVPSTILFHSVYGTGDTMATLLIQCVTTAIVLSACSYVAFGVDGSLDAVWMVRFIGAAVCVVLSLFVIRREGFAARSL